MATAAIFSSLRRPRSLNLQGFIAPVGLKNAALLESLSSVSSELTTSYGGKEAAFQRKNIRSLLRKIEVFGVLFENALDSSPGLRLSPTAIICFRELLYLLLYRAKMLFDFCFQSSKLWLLLQNHSISCHFHDLDQEITTLLDVFPFHELNLNHDTSEQLKLLHKQLRKSKLTIDRSDELLRLKFYSFLYQFERGDIPDFQQLCTFFVDELRVRDAQSCRAEIEFLAEQIVNCEADVEPAIPVLNGFVALTRYCRFLLFGFEEDELELAIEQKNNKTKKGLIRQEMAETFVSIPKDFCCPISLDLMSDPVIVSTGQTYDRDSISRWIEEGHCTCPKTGQLLAHTRLVPNRALRNLIVQWCTAHEIAYDPEEAVDSTYDCFVAACPSKAETEANRATSRLLIQHLATGSQNAKAIAAREIRLLAKTGRENRAYIAEAGAIPHLKSLLLSSNSVAQEDSVTALLNLSIYDKNKATIMDEEGCLISVVGVLRFGHTTEARENAAATLFSLSVVHDYKKRIAEEDGAVEALARLVMDGTPRGKKDAVKALFNLSTHTDNAKKMVESGAVSALVEALGCEGVAEEAAGALALIVRQPVGAEAVANKEMAVLKLSGMMRYGSPRGKENAVAALLGLCRGGGATATEKVLKAPALADLLQTLLFTGTKRARRKAASLARVFQRCENASLHFGGLGVEYAFAGNSAATRDTSFATDFPVPSISVP